MLGEQDAKNCRTDPGRAAATPPIKGGAAVPNPVVSI
jgi:hypothetical protein